MADLFEDRVLVEFLAGQRGQKESLLRESCRRSLAPSTRGDTDLPAASQLHLGGKFVPTVLRKTRKTRKSPMRYLRAADCPVPDAPTAFVPRPAEGLNYRNAADMFSSRVAKSPEHAGLRYRVRGAWRSLTWSAWRDRSMAFAAGLLEAFDLSPGAKIAIAAESSAGWVISDVAIAMGAWVSVPIYPTVTPEEARFILKDAACRVLIVDDDAQWRRIEGGEGPPISVEGVVLLRGQGARDQSDKGVPVRSFDEVETLGREALEVEAKADAIAGRAAHPGLDDLFSIVYTSGTTGQAKGVELTHKNIIYEAWAIRSTIAVDRNDEQLMILPLAHIFARHMIWAAIDSGATTAMGSGPHKVAADLVDVAPSFVGAVPRVYEKIYDRVMNEVANSGTAKQSLFAWAMDIGRRVSAYRQRAQPVPTLLAARMKVADRMVFTEIRRLLGGRLRFFVSGAAPLAREIAEFFHAAGVLVLEGYGLTESTGATHVNRPDRYRFGTVGPALPGCEVLIADDGEILLRGNNIMRGYHNNAEATAEAIDEDGWLHTGDVGELVDGFLRITHRKKEIIITAGGKNIAPLKIERRLQRNRGVAHVTVHGDRRPFAVALVALDEEEMFKLASEERLGVRSYAEMARHPRVREIVQSYVDTLNRGLASFETVKAFELLPEPLSEAGGTLTPTGKVRRRNVEERYADRLEALYAATIGRDPI